jgi:hypothetical protein
MQQYHKLSLVMPILAGSLAVLLGSGLLSLWGVWRGTFELQAARHRWAARPFSHYRLELKYGALGYCHQNIEVKADRVVAVLQDTCSVPAPTVDELFDRIERDFATLDGRCGPNGCACDGTIVVSAAYDPQLGFPHSKLVALNAGTRWRFADYWTRRMSGQLCTSWDLGREIITVVSLTPLT